MSAKVTPIASTVARVQNAQARGQRVQNAQATGSAGELGSGDRGGWSRVSPVSGNPYDQINYVERWRQLSQLYHTSWEAKKIVDIPVDDALRKDWIVEGLDEKQAKPIQNEFTRLKVLHELERELKMERLYGGCLGFLGMEGDKDDPEEPYKVDAGEALRFINTIPVSRISRTYWEQDPLSENYMRPRAYLVNGQEIHASRLLIFDGNPLYNVLDYSLQYPNKINMTGFGPSVLYTIWDDIMRAVGVRQASYQLTQVNGALIAAVSDLQDLAGTAPGKATLARIKSIAEQLSLYRAAMIADEKVTISQHSASFGSVPELLMMYLQVLAAASDIPARRFIGDGVMGLGSTDENALENYYNNIDSYQRRRIEPILRRLYDIIGYRIHKAAWRDMRKDLKFTFPPLFNERESVTCVTKAQYMTNVQTALDLNILDDDEAIEEINQKEIFGVTVKKKIIEREEDLTGEPVDVDEELNRLRAGGQTSGPPGAKAGPAEREPKESRFANVLIPDTAWHNLIKTAGYDWMVFDLAQVKKGFAVEQEHADVTLGDPVAVAKIVLAHLAEDGRYYDKLEQMENKFPPRRHTQFAGLDIMIETAKGERRKGRGEDGRIWSNISPADYGEIVCTGGVDGDPVDCYVGPNPEAQTVWIVHQNTLKGVFDEHKVIFGCDAEEQAIQLYCAGFNDGKGFSRIGKVESMGIEDFKMWCSTQNRGNNAS